MTNVYPVSTKLESIVSTKKDKGGKAPKSNKDTLIYTSKPVIIQIMGILRLESKEKMQKVIVSINETYIITPNLNGQLQRMQQKTFIIDIEERSGLTVEENKGEKPTKEYHTRECHTNE